MSDIHKNRARKRTALALIRRHDRTTWRHAAIEIARVPGEEKLRIRKSKGETATASVDEDLPSDATAPMQSDDGQAEPGEEQQLEGPEDADDQGINTSDEVRH